MPAPMKLMAIPSTLFAFLACAVAYEFIIFEMSRNTKITEVKAPEEMNPDGILSEDIRWLTKLLKRNGIKEVQVAGWDGIKGVFVLDDTGKVVPQRTISFATLGLFCNKKPYYHHSASWDAYEKKNDDSLADKYCKACCARNEGQAIFHNVYSVAKICSAPHDPQSASSASASPACFEKYILKLSPEVNYSSDAEKDFHTRGFYGCIETTRLKASQRLSTLNRYIFHEGRHEYSFNVDSHNFKPSKKVANLCNSNALDSKIEKIDKKLNIPLDIIHKEYLSLDGETMYFCLGLKLYGIKMADSEPIVEELSHDCIPQIEKEGIFELMRLSTS